MKWYWIVLIIVAVAIISYLIYKKMTSPNARGACRAGTCPYVRDDGSIFCTSAACKKADSVTEKTTQPTYTSTPSQTVVLVKSPVLPNKNVSSNSGSAIVVTHANPKIK